MPLSRDPDTLRVPAFMRKRSIGRSRGKSLLLTALDRKQAGILPEGVKKKKASAAKRKRPAVQLFSIPARKTRKKRVMQRKIKTVKAAPEVFSAPILDSTPPSPRQKQKIIGAITHYYDKIQVGVIALKGTLSVGDCITYEAAGGPYEQVVESMEINRQPVFKAGRGKEIGMKLRASPRVGCSVSVSC